MKKISFAFLIFLASVTAGAQGPAVPAVPGAGAPAATAEQPAGPPGGLFGSLFPMVAMFGVVYFLMIRPQQKRAREQKDMLGSLKHDDEVVTSSGILGKITNIAEKVVTIEVAKDVRIKVLKSQVSQVVKGQIKDLAT